MGVGAIACVAVGVRLWVVGGWIGGRFGLGAEAIPSLPVGAICGWGCVPEERLEGDADLLGEGGVGGSVAGEVGEAFDGQGAGAGFEVGGAGGAEGADVGQGGLEAGAGGQGADLDQRELVGAAEAEFGEAGVVPVLEQGLGEVGEVVGVEQVEGGVGVGVRVVAGAAEVVEVKAGGVESFCLGCVHGPKIPRGGAGSRGFGRMSRRLRTKAYIGTDLGAGREDTACQQAVAPKGEGKPGRCRSPHPGPLPPGAGEGGGESRI